MKVLQDPSDNRTKGVDLQNIAGPTSETTEIRTQTQVEHTNVSQYNKYGAADIEELESARGYAEAAKKSAEEAALSEEAAKNSEVVAFTSATQAVEANNDAQDAAERARVSAENAANSEQASYDSEVAAKNSEVEAERQASNASDSAAFAFESAENASRAKDLAEAAKTRSEEILAEVTPSVAAAAASAADAQQAASSAATSANNAAESELNAKESADVAKASEDIASSYVGAAKTYAEDAETSSKAAGAFSAEANTSMLEAQASAAGALANANASAASAGNSAQSAASSASSASSSELSANASAESAVTSAEEAAAALESKNIAVSSANTATTAANESTEAASDAKDSEDAAAASQLAASASASQALASKDSAEDARDAAIAAKSAAEASADSAGGILEEVEASAAAAKDSEIAAKASEDAALISQNQSKENADAAIAAKNAAEESEEAAAGSASASAQSSASAAGSASSASTSASTATTKAAEAVVSAQAAEGSASTASTKASQASLSAANASDSELAAENSASDSLASANASAASASNASDSEAVATAKATAAANSASSADASADAAHDSANDASASAANAAGSKTSAESAASSAGSFASAAETSKLAAQNSANAASASAASAADSEQRSQEIYEALMSTAVYRGGWNPQATQAYPDPKGINSTWDVFLNEGTASYEWDGVLWQSGDRLIYSTPDDQYFHINQVRGVTSVNGKSGDVLISATDVGAYSKSESDARYAETAGENTFSVRNYFNQGLTSSSSIVFNQSTASSMTLVSIPNVSVNATACINWGAGNNIMSFTRKNDTSSSGASVTIHGDASSTSAPTATSHLTRKDYVDAQIATRLPVGGKAADSEKVDGIDGANIFHTSHLPTWNEVSGKPTTFAPSTHNHDTLYYTKAQSDTNYVNQVAANLNYSVDWNTLDKTNTYSIYRGSGVTFANACPNADYGTLLVIGRDTTTVSFVTQIYTSRAKNEQYVRSRNDGTGTWTAWSKIYNSSNKPTTSELGVYSKSESDARYAETAGENIFTSTNRFQSRTYLQNLESQPLVFARTTGNESSKDDVALLSMSDGGIDWTINNSDDSGDATFQFNGVNTSDAKYNILSLTNTSVSTGIAQGTSGNSLTRKDYVDGQIATRLPTGGKAADSAKLNGVAESTAQTANTIVKRDSAGDVVARLVRTTYGNQDTISGAIAFRTNSSTDNYTRYCSSPAAVRGWLDTYSKGEADGRYLGKTAKAADSDKLDGLNSTSFANLKSASFSFGGTSGNWTTAEFIAWITAHGAFSTPYWVARGSWTYDANKTITDTGCGNIHLSGALVEVIGTAGGHTIRVTAATTSSNNGMVKAEWVYVNNGPDYHPGWRRAYNTASKPTAAELGVLPLSGGTLTGRLTANARITALGSGNDYDTGGVELLGNGSANTVFPTLGFHQPAKFASSIQLRNGGDFRFYAQGASSYASITAANITANGTLSVTGGLVVGGLNVIGTDATTVRLGETSSNRTVTLDAKDGVVNVVNQTGSSYRVYHTGYKPTVDDISGVVKTSEVSTTGSFAGMVNKIPRVQGNGVMEVARFIDFHTIDSTADYDIRLDCNTANNLNVTGGTLQNEGATVYTTARKPTAADVGAYASGSTVVRATASDNLRVNTSTSSTYYPLLSTSATAYNASGTCYIPTGANIPKVRCSDGHTQIVHGYLGISGLAFNTEGYVYPRDTNHRDAGMYGSYDATKIGHIWSMGTSFKIPANGANFGTLHGLAYKHTNNTTGGTMAGGHQAVWCINGSPRVSLGENLWAGGKVIASSGVDCGQGVIVDSAAGGETILGAWNGYETVIRAEETLYFHNNSDDQQEVHHDGNAIRLLSRGKSWRGHLIERWSDGFIKVSGVSTITNTSSSSGSYTINLDVTFSEPESAIMNVTFKGRPSSGVYTCAANMSSGSVLVLYPDASSLSTVNSMVCWEVSGY